MKAEIKHELDWSGYQDQGMGDAYADIPRSGGDFAKAVSVCINSGVCEELSTGLMCPSYRIDKRKVRSPGGRVSLFKRVLNMDDPDALQHDKELAAAMDDCISCKGCKRECESNLDMAMIKVEYLAQRLKNITFFKKIRPTYLRAWLFAEWPFLLYRYPWLKWGMRARNAQPWLAKLTQYLLRINAGVILPEPAKQPFRCAQQVYSPSFINTRGGNKNANNKTAHEVVLWIDTFTALFQPEVAQDALALLLNAGYCVTLVQPESPGDGNILDSGRTLLSQGRVDRTREEASKLLAVLVPHVQKGRLIIGLEPSALLMLRDEYKVLGLGEQAQDVAGAALLLEEFIAKERINQRFNLRFISAKTEPALLVHGHCHQKSVGAMKSVRKVLRLIPDIDFSIIESSCCGMAGTFGMEIEHAVQSRKMAELSLLPALRLQPDATVLSTGFSCAHQIKATTSRQTVHLASYLAAHMITN
ncbi:MAG: (Fe-S)-binding protein [Psychromonas sp.]